MSSIFNETKGVFKELENFRKILTWTGFFKYISVLKKIKNSTFSFEVNNDLRSTSLLLY